MSFPTAFAALVAALWLIVLVRGLWTAGRLQGLPETSAAAPAAETSRDLAALTVYVPCRDEVEVIEASVGALLREPVGKVVVIDDQSSDGSRACLDLMAAADPRLVVIPGHGPEPGQCGKPAALAAAVDAEPPLGPWLLFVDADVVVQPAAVRRLLDFAAAKGADLVSVFPRLILSSALERVVMPAVGALIVSRYPADAVRDPKRPIAFANGQLILVRRQAYEDAGGHRAVISEVLEDVRFAERVKAAGGQLALLDGRDVAATRMYDGWQELFEGWTKNLYLLLGGSGLTALSTAFVVSALGLSGLLALVVAGWPYGAAVYAWSVLCQMILRARLSAPVPWAVLAPVGALVTSYLVLSSARRHGRGGGITWKGRRYEP